MMTGDGILVSLLLAGILGVLGYICSILRGMKMQSVGRPHEESREYMRGYNAGAAENAHAIDYERERGIEAVSVERDRGIADEAARRR